MPCAVGRAVSFLSAAEDPQGVLLAFPVVGRRCAAPRARSASAMNSRPVGERTGACSTAFGGEQISVDGRYDDLSILGDSFGAEIEIPNAPFGFGPMRIAFGGPIQYNEFEGWSGQLTATIAGLAVLGVFRATDDVGEAVDLEMSATDRGFRGCTIPSRPAEAPRRRHRRRRFHRSRPVRVRPRRRRGDRGRRHRSHHRR